MFKFLPGIIFVQIISACLVYIAINWSLEPQLIVSLIIFSIIIAILITFWFGSISNHIHHASHAKLQEKHAKEREKILLKAEREKAKISSKNSQKINQSTKNVIAKANFKVGLAVAATIGIGGIMMMSQLVTIGMMLFVASGSGLAGYLARSRQESLSNENNLFLKMIKHNKNKPLSKNNDKPELEDKG
ncbi:MAG: hypothetical protein KZQ83_08825 [gamma proteobacterium symbiont of Taylorina sp.]|nr:hypothetical protein [gamma proteobacterium symbiont of Taylorina sp.]